MTAAYDVPDLDPQCTFWRWNILLSETRCDRPSAVILTMACPHEHLHEMAACAPCGEQIMAATGWMCNECRDAPGDASHDCLVTWLPGREYTQ